MWTTFRSRSRTISDVAGWMQARHGAPTPHSKRSRSANMTVTAATTDLASRPPHASSIEDVVHALGTDVNHGLPSAAAVERLARYGRNELAQAPSEPWWERL